MMQDSPVKNKIHKYAEVSNENDSNCNTTQDKRRSSFSAFGKYTPLQEAARKSRTTMTRTKSGRDRVFTRMINSAVDGIYHNDNTKENPHSGDLKNRRHSNPSLTKNQRDDENKQPFQQHNSHHISGRDRVLRKIISRVVSTHRD
mmetsp:Transcript_12525/g.18914  ORF Transcript_12525/g.18914 Transcript_12525/m.18914 type:complete len:145 (-) Transcript_12525:261-695(-)